MNNVKAGMIVDCLGSRLGTVRAVQGKGAERVLEVQPDRMQGAAGLLHIPARLVAQVLGETVLLNVSCEEATRLGQGVITTAMDTTAAARPATTTVPIPQVPSPLAGRVPPNQVRAEVLTADSVTVPVIEETLVPVTQWQEAGALEIRKSVHVVNQELDVPVQYEEATVERVPVNRVLAAGETLAPRQDGDTLVIPIVHEELMVVKRQVLVEEVRITKQIRTTTRHFSEPVRREDIQITHQGLEAQPTEGPAH